MWNTDIIFELCFHLTLPCIGTLVYLTVLFLYPRCFVLFTVLKKWEKILTKKCAEVCLVLCENTHFSFFFVKLLEFTMCQRIFHFHFKMPHRNQFNFISRAYVRSLLLARCRHAILVMWHVFFSHSFAHYVLLIVCSSRTMGHSNQTLIFLMSEIHTGDDSDCSSVHSVDITSFQSI